MTTQIEFPKLSPTEIRHLADVQTDLRKKRHIKYNLAAKKLERCIHKEEMVDIATYNLLMDTMVATPPAIRAFDKIRKAIEKNDQEAEKAKKKADKQAEKARLEAEKAQRRADREARKTPAQSDQTQEQAPM